MTLVAFYPLDRDVKDYSGNNYNGTNNGVTFATGKVNNAGLFEAANNDTIILPNLTSLTALSIACWVKINTTSANNRILDVFGSDGNSQIILLYNTGTSLPRFVLGNSIGTTSDVSGTTDIDDGSYHFFVVTWDGTTTKIYIDGVLENSGSLTGTIDLSTVGTRKHIGSNAGSGNFFDGLIDNLRVYDHVLTSDEITDLYNEGTGTAININGTVYTQYYYEENSFYTDNENTYKIDIANLAFNDDDNLTMATLFATNDKKEFDIIVDGDTKFTGLLENYYLDENDFLIAELIDLTLILNGDLITIYDCNSQTADTIIQDLIDTYGQSVFTTNLAATTKTYDDIFHSMTALEIMQELTLRESYYLKLDADKVWNFQSRTSNDLGLIYVEGLDFFNPSFPKLTNRVKNTFYAIDSTGQAYKKQDLTSVSNNYARADILDLPDATTEDQVREYLNARVYENSDKVIPATVEVPQDFTLTSSGLIRINYQQLGWVNQLSYIIGIKQFLDIPYTIIELVNYSPNIDQALNDLLWDRRQLQKRNIDYTKSLIVLADITLTISVSLTVVVEKQTVATRRRWNEGSWNSGPAWNFQSSTWTEVVAESVMRPMNALLNRLRDLVQGEAVTALDAANTKIELGSGTTSVKVTDTDLATPIVGTEQGMDAGYPQDDSSDGTIQDTVAFQGSMDDTDVVSFTSQEVALWEGSNLMARGVLDTSFSKTSNEAFRVRIKMSFANSGLATLMNRFYEKVRDVVQGAAVNALDNSNSFIEYGTGTTLPTVTDTDLDTPIAATKQGMDASFPADGVGTGEMDHQNSVVDGDIVSFTAYEWGFFENSNLQARGILGGSLSKSSGETIRTRIKTTFEEA